MKRLGMNNPTLTAKEIKFNMESLLPDVPERTIQERLQKRSFNHHLFPLN